MDQDDINVALQVLGYFAVIVFVGTLIAFAAIGCDSVYN